MKLNIYDLFSPLEIEDGDEFVINNIKKYRLKNGLIETYTNNNEWKTAKVFINNLVVQDIQKVTREQ